VKALAVTYDDRPFVIEYCRENAARFELLNGIPAQVIPVDAWPRVHEPMYGKLWLWELVPKGVDYLIWFDSDVLPVRPFGDLPSAPMGMVCDNKDWVKRDLWTSCPTICGCWPYFNTGVILMRRDAESILVAAREHLPKDGPERARWAGLSDQNAINRELQLRGVQQWCARLPDSFNHHSGINRGSPSSAMMLHLSRHPRIPDKWWVMELLLNAMPREGLLSRIPVPGQPRVVVSQ